MLFLKAQHESQFSLYEGLRVDRETKQLIDILKKDERKFRASARKLGFKKVSWGNGSVFKGKRFVIKDPCTCGDRRPRRACKTIRINQFWVLQPKLDKLAIDFNKKDFDLVRAKFSIPENARDADLGDWIPGFGEDAHHDNWGILNGEFVQHDW